ncbi:MAG: multidrug efflux SMR transporter [Aquincola sp.]|nr:multidrug efflux SMR transporter [Aquincola sp.]MDH5328908.1 multidrug efflux SMR transporter [Aquincola sp.]
MLDVSSTKAAWAVLVLSGLLEVAFAAAIQASNGFTRFVPAALAVVSGGLSVYLMSITLSVIPLGTAYAVWGGVGAVGTAAMGLVLYGEPAAPARLFCIALVVAGIVGLQWFEGARGAPLPR